VDDEAGGVGISSALEALRGELEEAWQASQGQRVRFRVTDVTLTVQVVARREKEGGGKVRWYLIEAGAEARSASETTQSLVLTLTPSLYDESGREGPLDVSGDEPVPAG
jgi:hypothetical protein